jgi:hypothetical protein
MFKLMHLERVRGKSYVKIANAIGQLLEQPELDGSILAVDATGVGRPEVDLLREQIPVGLDPGWASYVPGARIASKLVPITFTSGNRATDDGQGGYHVPKKDLVGAAKALVNSRRIKMDRTHTFVPELIRELQNFRVKITQAANETFSAWREKDKDDLVFALAMASWAGLNLGQASFYIGLDLGQTSDFTALAILRGENPSPVGTIRSWMFEGEEEGKSYPARIGQRMPYQPPSVWDKVRQVNREVGGRLLDFDDD